MAPQRCSSFILYSSHKAAHDKGEAESAPPRTGSLCEVTTNKEREKKGFIPGPRTNLVMHSGLEAIFDKQVATRKSIFFKLLFI